MQGIIGFLTVSKGNLVGPGQNSVLATMSSVDPMRVTFGVSEEQYLHFYKLASESKSAGAPELAYELILTGRRIKADEAKAIGLAAQVYPAASWLDDAKALARTIAEKPPVAARLATEAVDLAWNSTLDAGLEFERKAFYLLFATEDKKEGVDAFVNKRKATFKGR